MHAIRKMPCFLVLRRRIVLAEQAGKETIQLFLQTIPQPDIAGIVDDSLNKIVIGGKIKNAMYRLLKQICDKQIFLVSDEETAVAVSPDMIKIYEAESL